MQPTTRFVSRLSLDLPLRHHPRPLINGEKRIRVTNRWQISFHLFLCQVDSHAVFKTPPLLCLRLFAPLGLIAVQTPRGKYGSCILSINRIFLRLPGPYDWQLGSFIPNLVIVSADRKSASVLHEAQLVGCTCKILLSESFKVDLFGTCQAVNTSYPHVYLKTLRRSTNYLLFRSYLLMLSLNHSPRDISR